MNDILRIFTSGGAAAVVAAPPYALPGLVIIAFGVIVTGLIALARLAKPLMWVLQLAVAPTIADFQLPSAARVRTDTLVCYYSAKLTGMWRGWIPARYAGCAAAGAIRVAIQMPARNGRFSGCSSAAQWFGECSKERWCRVFGGILTGIREKEFAIVQSTPIVVHVPSPELRSPSWSTRPATSGTNRLSPLCSTALFPPEPT